MSTVPQPTVLRRVGVVGAGQLARMMGEAANGAQVDITVLAESMNDSAVATCAEVEIGSPADREALLRLARRVEVITFDHELVDLDLLGRTPVVRRSASTEQRGTPFRRG